MSYGHVFRHPADKRRAPCGYRPVAGMLRDGEGRLILEYVYPNAAPGLQHDPTTPAGPKIDHRKEQATPGKRFIHPSRMIGNGALDLFG